MEIKINKIKKRKGTRTRLATPRITPRVFPDYSDQTKKLIMEAFDLSEITDIYTMEPPEFDPIFARMFAPVFRTLDRYPEVLETQRNYMNAIHKLHSLSNRETELLIIRTAWLNRAEYVFSVHAAGALMDSELNMEEINQIIEGANASGWNDEDCLLIRVADNLYEDTFIDDELWDNLSKRYETDQIVGIVFLVGFYTLISMFTNSLGIQVGGKVSGFGEFSEKLNQREEKREKEGHTTFKMLRKAMNKLFLSTVQKF
jgi:alkylhydroperoxidase family enzyme